MEPFVFSFPSMSTELPQTTVYAAMHQDYSEDAVCAEDLPNEAECGKRIVKHLLQGHRGHFGPFEHPQMVVNCVGYSHEVMQQLRTHRVGCSFDVQSGRYTGKRILDVVEDIRPIEDVFWFRPSGVYHDRSGKKYEYTDEDRVSDLELCYELCCEYYKKIKAGWSEEHARQMIPYCIRQNFVLSANARAWMHLLLVRGKADVQYETLKWAEAAHACFSRWMPETAEWFDEHLWKKGRLAP